MNKRVLITAMMVMVLSFAVVSQHAHAQSYHFNLDLNDLVKKAFGNKTGNEETASEKTKKTQQHGAVQHAHRQDGKRKAHVRNKSRKRRAPPPAASVRTLSFWQGTMRCGRGDQRIMRFTLSDAGQGFAGELEIAPFTSTFGESYKSLKMQGSMDQKSGRFQLTPAQWIKHPNNGKPVSLQGIIAKDKETMQGKVSGGRCTTFTASYFKLSMPPVNPKGLLFKVAKKSPPLTEADCLSFEQWLNSGKILHLPYGTPSSQLFDDQRMRAVLGKSLFQWGKNDYRHYRNIKSQCTTLARNTVNIKLSEAFSSTRSVDMRALSYRKEKDASVWVFLENQYISVYLAFKQMVKQKTLAMSVPQTLEGIAAITSLLAENQKKNNTLAWLPKEEFKAHETFLKEQQAEISDSLVDLVASDLDGMMNAQEKNAEINKISTDAFGTTVDRIPDQNAKFKAMLIAEKNADNGASPQLIQEEDSASYSPLTSTKYLNEMPRPDQIMVDIQGSSQLDTAARQYAAFSILIDMVVSLSPRKPNQGTNIWLSPEELQRNGQYSQTQSEISTLAISMVNPSGTDMQAQYQWVQFAKQYAWQGKDHFMQQLLKRYFSEELQEIYLKILHARRTRIKILKSRLG